MKTNFSYIISLSPSELATLLYRIWYDGYEQGYAEADHLPSASPKPTQVFPSTPTAYLSWLNEQLIHKP